MSGLSRRTVTVAATSATLGLALLASAAPAGADTCLPPLLGLPPVCLPTVPGVPAVPVVPGVPGVPGVPALPTDPAQLLQTLSALTPQQITDALALANGLTPAQAAQLLTAVQAALASPDPVGGVAAIATQLATGAGVPGIGAGGGTGAGGGGTGTGTGSGTGTGTGAGTGAGGTTPGGAAVSKAFRASLTGLKLAHNRRSAKVTVLCPTTAPGCVVGLTGKVGSRKAFKARIIGLAPGAAATKKIKLSKAAAKRLRSAKGGKLKVTAATAGSSLSPRSKSVKAKAKHSHKR